MALLQTLPTDLFLLEVVPYLSLLDKLALYDTSKFFRSLFPYLYQTIKIHTIASLASWATTPLSAYSYPEEPQDTYHTIILPICSIQPSLRPSFEAFYKLIYNMHYFNLLQLNNAPYRMQQKEIQNSPFATELTKLATALYIQKFKNYPPLINNEEDPYAPIVYMNRVIPDEINIRKLAASHFDLATLPDYTEVSTALAQALVPKILIARHPNYQYKHSYNTQNEKFQALLKTIPDNTTDPFLSIIKSLQIN
jgi:hypothetical protein